jgi:hypothetical protein
VSKFFLTTDSTPSLNPPSKRKALSHSVPATANSTPVQHARGANQRISLLKRRSLTPYRRHDPPLRTPASSALPFSIDAALSGTISSYSTPVAAKPIPTPSSALFAPSPSVKARKAAPKTWFFAIHEDSPDQEATNLLYHGASVLDISSDDDGASARAKDAAERGKENIPPPDAVPSAASVRPAGAASARRAAHRGISCPDKAAEFEAAAVDAMAEDRVALREMDVRAFWPAGADDEDAPEEPAVQASAAAIAGEAEGILVREDTPERVEL